MQDWRANLEELADASTGVVNNAMAQHISTVGEMIAHRDEMPPVTGSRS
jgi:hypothetical protein